MGQVIRIYGAVALWKIWPSLPAKTKKAIRDGFDKARSIAMKVSDRSIELDVISAKVMAQYAQEFTPKNGNQQRSSGPITFGLEKKDGIWTLTSVR